MIVAVGKARRALAFRGIAPRQKHLATTGAGELHELLPIRYRPQFGFPGRGMVENQIRWGAGA
jgi:hypothetical protein